MLFQSKHKTWYCFQKDFFLLISINVIIAYSGVHSRRLVCTKCIMHT